MILSLTPDLSIVILSTIDQNMRFSQSYCDLGLGDFEICEKEWAIDMDGVILARKCFLNRGGLDIKHHLDMMSFKYR